MLDVQSVSVRQGLRHAAVRMIAIRDVLIIVIIDASIVILHGGSLQWNINDLCYVLSGFVVSFALAANRPLTPLLCRWACRKVFSSYIRDGVWYGRGVRTV